jgi:hypothetical protein
MMRMSSMRRNTGDATRIAQTRKHLIEVMDELEHLFYSEPVNAHTAEMTLHRLGLAQFLRGQLIGLGAYPGEDDQGENYISDVLGDVESAIALAYGKSGAVKSNGRR